MVAFEGFILGFAAIGFLAFYASVNIKKDEVPIGRYIEKGLFYGIGLMAMMGIGLVMVLQAENDGTVSHLLSLSNSWFTGLTWAGYAIIGSFSLYVLIKATNYFRTQTGKKDEDETR